MKVHVLLAVFWAPLAAPQAKPAAAPAEDLCVAPPANARPSLPARLMPGHGRIQMPITTKSPQAQEFFNQGVALMHSFWGREAERSFLQAAELDPEAAMPQWGIAMVAAGDYRPTFQLMSGGRRPSRPRGRPAQGGLARAREAAEKARKLAAAVTRREQLYIAAVAARRTPDAKDPETAYRQALRALLKEFPGEVEAKSYLALALMTGYSRPDKKPGPGTEESYALLQEILRADSDHVGANHYIIHVLEGSNRPQDAWASAKRYPELAPENAHARHMPGHIYVQSDRWADAAQAFEQAARLERQDLAADQLYPNQHHGHNVHFMTSAYASMGDYDAAMKNSGELLQIRENPRERKEATNGYTAHRQGWFARLRTLVYFARWDEILEGSKLPDYPQPRQRAWRHWARGVAYAHRGDAGSARAELERMGEQIKAWSKLTSNGLPHLRAARAELRAHIQVSSGRTGKGLEALERAARMEERLPYNEPPAYPRPVWEAMGQRALETRQWARAEAAFRRALEFNPGSPRAKQGLAVAQSRSGAAVAGGQ